MEKQNRTAKNQINFRVTMEEFASLWVAADRAGLSVPALCKRAALGTKVRPQIIDKEVGKAILPHLSHIGSNLNQLAKKANEGGTVAAKELAEVTAQFEALWAYILEGKKPTKKPAKTTEEQLEEATEQTRLDLKK